MPIIIQNDGIEDSGEQFGLILAEGDGYLNSALKYLPQENDIGLHSVTIYNHE